MSTPILSRLIMEEGKKIEEKADKYDKLCDEKRKRDKKKIM